MGWRFASGIFGWVPFWGVVIGGGENLPPVDHVAAAGQHSMHRRPRDGVHQWLANLTLSCGKV